MFDRLFIPTVCIFLLAVSMFLGFIAYLEYHKTMECKPYLMEFKFQGDSDG